MHCPTPDHVAESLARLIIAAPRLDAAALRLVDSLASLDDEAPPLRYGRRRPDADTDDAEVWAAWLVDLLNALAAAGSPPDEQAAEAVEADLQPLGWALQHTAEGWCAVPLPGGDDMLLQYAARAPRGGISLGGRDYRGGQFIPGEAVAAATPEERARLAEAEAEAERRAGEKRQERLSRGAVAVAALAERLVPYRQRVPLSRAEATGAATSWRLLARHHGEAALHRVAELVQLAEQALDRLPAGERHAGRRARLERHLARLAQVLEVARYRPAESFAPGAPPAKPEPGKVYAVGTQHLHMDPGRFQFKISGVGASGVTAELQQVRAWNPDFAGVVSVWRDPADGKTYVVNGHHRRELAGRLGVRDLAVRYITARDAREARAIGALVNIAEGRGTAIDAAKFLRDTGTTIDQLEARGVSLRGRLAADAAILTRLSDRSFDRLARGLLDEGTALAVAQHLPDHQLQDQLFALLERREDEGKDTSPRVVSEMAREMAQTPTHTRTEASLFGDISSVESLFVQRAEIKAHVRAELAREVSDFLAVASRRRAERVGAAGNVLDVSRNREIAAEAERAKNVFDTLVNRRGAISDAINDAAANYASAKTKRERDAVKQRALAAIKQAVLAELGRG